uniref:Uncharacterized protein n=1 Tax=Arundo donax TaxID=35708 RepID=A0A0A9A613_ARUDO
MQVTALVLSCLGSRAKAPCTSRTRKPLEGGVLGEISAFGLQGVGSRQ